MPAGAVPSLIVAAVVLPLAGALAAFAAPRAARVIAVIVAAALALDVAVLAGDVAELAAGAAEGTAGASGEIRLELGGWAPPLGIALHVDGLTLFMLLTTAAANLGVGLYAYRYFHDGPGNPAGFAPLSLLLVAGLNALFLSGDVFNAYVTLELIGLAGAALVARAGDARAFTGALRYLLVTLVGSLTFLLGAALLYHEAGTLDMRLLGESLGPSPAAWTALASMTAALLLKTALFPLHFWLPPAHSTAPAPVSALLSALVVEASLYLLLRLWLDVMPADKALLGSVLGAFGMCAVLWGSVLAMRQDQLKLLVAYSTVAQLGYLFMPFAIESPALAAIAWRGAAYLVLCHALAKAAMFLAVGNIQTFGGDRVRELDHVVQRLPLTMAAFAIAGLTIAGLPPSGGFVAKWLILEAAVAEGRWALAAVVLVGGLLSSIYVFRVIGPAFTRGDHPRPPQRVPNLMEWVPFALACATLVLGFTAPPLLGLLDVGAPLAARVEVPD